MTPKLGKFSNLKINAQLNHSRPNAALYATTTALTSPLNNNQQIKAFDFPRNSKLGSTFYN